MRSIKTFGITCIMIMLTFSLCRCGNNSVASNEITFSQLLSEDRILHFIWLSNDVGMDEITENDIADQATTTIVLKDGKAAMLNTTAEFNSYEDMTVGEVAAIPKDEIIKAAEKCNEFSDYIITGFSYEGDELYDETLYVRSDTDDENEFSIYPYTFEMSKTITLNGKKYYLIYYAPDEGVQILLTEYSEGKELIFDDVDDVYLNLLDYEEVFDVFKKIRKVQ